MRSEEEVRQERIRAEVISAIRAVSGAGGGTMRVLEYEEEVRCRFTCPKCYCHVASHFRMPTASGSRVYSVCAVCRTVYG